MQTQQTYTLTLTSIVDNAIMYQAVFINLTKAQIKQEVENTTDVKLTRVQLDSIITNAGIASNTHAEETIPVCLYGYLHVAAFTN